MKKRSLKIFGLLFFAFIAFWGYIGWDGLRTMKRKVIEAEAKGNLVSLYTTEEAYKKEYKKYSADFKEIAFTSEGKRGIQYYLEVDKIPQDLRGRLTPDELPVVSADKFRALAIISRDDGITVIAIDNTKKISVRRELR